MPDSFFTSSRPRKRKRSESSAHTDVPGKSKKIARKTTTTSQEGKKSSRTKVNGVHKRKSRVDEELSDQTDEGDGGVDDMNLRVHDDDVGASGEEDENETPAEKRLRLAQLYLNSVKVDLGEPRNWFFFEAAVLIP